MRKVIGRNRQEPEPGGWMWKWKQKWDSEQIVLVCWALGVTRLQAVGTRWVYISLRMVIGSFKKIFVLSCKQQWLNILCSTTFSTWVLLLYGELFVTWKALYRLFFLSLLRCENCWVKRGVCFHISFLIHLNREKIGFRIAHISDSPLWFGVLWMCSHFLCG